MKFINVIVVVLAVGLGLAACGSSTSQPTTPVRSKTPAFTASEGMSICNDVNSWLKTAENQDMPRFNATLESDESEAARTQLGSDLSSLDDDLQQMNSDALMPGPPGDPQPIQAVESDCKSYGVTITSP